jgi:threonylcarbamoyladenosine tRNA methylthiotransferase MtaB
MAMHCPSLRILYSAADYQRAVSLIRETMPDAAITTDVIVGFPGETEAEFEESYNFCRKEQFARIHVFPYSPRQGTEAAGMPHQVSDEVKKERSRRMLALAKKSAFDFIQQFLGEAVITSALALGLAVALVLILLPFLINLGQSFAFLQQPPVRLY